MRLYSKDPNKHCPTCGEVKDRGDFYKNASTKDGLYYQCKVCKEKAKAIVREKFKSRTHIEYPETKRCCGCGDTKHNSEFNKNSGKKSGLSDRCKVCNAKYNKHRFENNREKMLADTYAWQNRKYKEDSLFRLKVKMRALLRHGLKRGGWKKSSSTLEAVGCSYEDLKHHIESQFTSGMSWDNIHVDHIVPLSYANTQEEMMYLCHWTNLQPLFSEDNISKKDRLDWSDDQARLLSYFNKLFRSRDAAFCAS